jgi:hypothetical protein
MTAPSSIDISHVKKILFDDAAKVKNTLINVQLYDNTVVSHPTLKYMMGWLPIVYSKEFGKYSIQSSPELRAFLSEVDELVAFANKTVIDTNVVKHSKLVRNDWVNLHVTDKTLSFDDNKKPFDMETGLSDTIMSGKWECRLVFNIGSVRTYRKYLCSPLYAVQIQLRPRKTMVGYTDKCLFEDE